MRLLVCLSALCVTCSAVARAQVATTYTYDNLGRLSQATFTNENVTYKYDPAGNRTSVLTQTNNPPGHKFKAIRQKNRTKKQ